MTAMTMRRCPACGRPVENNVSPSGECLSCGHDLVATAPPPAWRPRPGVDLRMVAKRQRTLLWFVLAIIVVNFLVPLVVGASGPVPTWMAGGQIILMLAVQVAAIVVIVALQAALGVHLAWRIVCVLLLMVPCANLLVLLSINSQATMELKRAGLKVGLLGVADEAVVRVLSPHRCTTCGYLLTGNISGTCPECGAALAQEIPP